MVVIACSSSDSDGDAAKLREFQKMQRLHKQQTEDTTNTINQSSGGFSLINIQWASFATGATTIIVCALLFFAVVVCCWIRTKNIRRYKRSHSQLLDVLRSRSDPVPESDLRTRPGSVKPSAPSSAPDKWLRTPTGWTSVPEAYQLPAASQYGLPQLPYPQFPPVVYHGGHHTFSQCGFPGCGREYQGRPEPLPYRSRAQLEFREPRFTELDSATQNTLERRAPRYQDFSRESPREATRQAHLEPAVRFRSSRPQARPRARRASDTDTFATPIAVHFPEEGIPLDRAEDRQGQARTGVYSD